MNQTNTPNPMQSRRGVLIALLSLTLFSGVVHGYIDGRWTTAENKTAQAKLLEKFPETLGDWTLSGEQELDEATQRLLRCYGSFVRVYRHSETGETVNVALLYGPRGPIAVHTPEVCYSSVGTRQTRPRVVETFDGNEGDHTLWSVEFSRDENVDPSLKVYYGWSSGGNFVAAESPRFWLTDELYKLQLAGPVTGTTFDPCKSFLETFVPHLESVVQ